MIYFILNFKTFISPKFTQVYRSLPQFTSVYLSLPQFTLVYLQFIWVYLSIMLESVEDNSKDIVSNEHFIKQKKIKKEIFRVFESFQFNPNIFKQKNLSIPKFTKVS